TSSPSASHSGISAGSPRKMKTQRWRFPRTVMASFLLAMSVLQAVVEVAKVLDQVHFLVAVQQNADCVPQVAYQAPSEEVALGGQFLQLILQLLDQTLPALLSPSGRPSTAVRALGHRGDGRAVYLIPQALQQLGGGFSHWSPARAGW